MRHIEFFHIDHFENDYHRVKPAKELASFIDFYWETKFDDLWNEYPSGFSDALFPNIGYTYLFNLGTPFVMQVGKEKFNMRTDGFLPRHQNIECFHQAGNRLFGIKFRVSPVIFETPVNFSEYNQAIFPLSYLIEPTTLRQIKQYDRFEDRVNFLNDYYTRIIRKYQGAMLPVNIVSEVISRYGAKNCFEESVEKEAERYKISSRTLQRYFEKCTGLSTKKTLQILRIRKAMEAMIFNPETFTHEQFGYYDYSHYYRHLRQFIPNELMRQPGIFFNKRKSPLL